MLPLLPDDWREQLRAYLSPFELPPASDEERRGEWNRYRLQTPELTETASDGSWGTFRLGNSVLHHLGTPQYGGEESQEVIWAAQSDFATPLHFWAAAMMFQSVFLMAFSDPWFNTALADLCFNFRIQPLAQAITALPAPTLEQLLLSQGWPQHKLAIPPILNEAIISGWRLNDQWNDLCALYCTESLYCLWNWHTAA